MAENLIRKIEEKQKIVEKPSFKVGDTVKVHFKIIEGKTERIQIYEGLVLCFKNAGIGRTFTVRKNSYGVGKVEVVHAGKVRRGKLYYIREKIGKAAKLKTLLQKKN